MRRPYHPVELCLAGLAAGATSVLLLLYLAAIALTGHGDAFDPALLLWIRAETGGSGPIVALAKGITAFGNDVTLWTVTLLAAGYLVAARERGLAVYVLAAAGGGGLLTSSLKWLVGRPRPAIVTHLVEVHPPSFPSGHAANSAFVYGTLAMVAVARAAHPAARSYIAAAMLLLVVMIGSSRAVLGVHWPSDILAGWAAGSAWTILAARVAGRRSALIEHRHQRGLRPL